MLPCEHDDLHEQQFKVMISNVDYSPRVPS
jgi:hypothetical protein